MTYAEKLKDPRWQKKRLEILQRDEFTCQLCGDKEITLHVHHKSYGNNPWESQNKNLITYCEHCHAVVEYYKQESFLSDPIRVFKYHVDSYYMIYVLGKGQTNNRFNLFLFDFLKSEKTLDFRSGIASEIIDAINKELRIQKKKHRS